MSVSTSISTADHSASPPNIEIPRLYNAAVDLVERNLAKRAGASSPMSTTRASTASRNSPSA